MSGRTDPSASCWPWSHRWTKWTDKQWSKLLRDRPLFATSTSTAPGDDPAEIGLECTQERRCKTCNQLQLRSVQTRI